MADPRSGRSDLDTDSNSHSVSSLGGRLSGSMLDVSFVEIAFSKDVGRMESNLRESLEITLARALPA